MLYFNTTKQNIVDAVSKKVFWAFEISTEGGGYGFEDEGGYTFEDEGGYTFDGGVGANYYWSTVSRSWNGNTYEYKVIPESFNGVSLNRNKSELGLHSPNILKFDITNSNNVIGVSNFLNAKLTLKLVINDYTNEEIIRQWDFIVKRVDPGRQVLHFYCEDFISRYIKGSYPNTQYVKDIFPASNVALDDNVCIPEPYGISYIPIRSIYDSDHNTYTSTTIYAMASSNGQYCKIIDPSSGLGIFEIGRSVAMSGFASTTNSKSAIILTKAATQLEFAQSEGLVNSTAGPSITLTQGSRTYLLGTTEYTFSIKKVRSPRDTGKKSEWSSTAYTFSQAIKTDPSTNNWRTFQPIINDVNNDGIADAPGHWQQGEVFLDMPTRFTRSDSSALTNPADIIKNVLGNMGIAQNRLKIDSGLVGYWSFNSGTSGTTSISDGSTYNVTFQVYNNPGWTTGISGKAVSITSSSHYCKSTGLTNLPSSKISVSLWFKRTGGGSTRFQELLIHDYASANGTWRVYISTGSVNFAVKTSSGFIRSYKTTPITTTGWNHIVGIYDGSIAKLFYNGSSATVSSSQAVALQSTGSLQISSSFVAFSDVDEVRIYNKALTSTEVGELYSNPSMRGWWSNARDTYNKWGLSWNGSFWYKEFKENVLAKLLNMCHSVLQVEDKIELRPLIADSQITVDRSYILTSGKEIADTTFKYQNTFVSDEYSDCGYIAWQQTGQAQDRFLQVLVGAKNSVKTKISNEILEIPFVQDSQKAQIIGILYYQRLLLRKAILSFVAKSSLIALQPDDVITINYADYGGTYNVLIENINIKRNLSIEINCVLFSETLDDWEDLTPSAIVVAEDDASAKVWEPALVGSLSDKDIGKQLWAKSYLVVGQYANQGDYTDIQSAINALKGANYSGIYIRKGSYTLSSPVYLPSTISVDVIGENREDVIIKPTSGIDGFILSNCKQSYNFSNFKILSQDSSSQTSYSDLISVTSSTGIFNFSNLFFSNLKESESSILSGNIGINIQYVTGSLKINNCLIDGGLYGIYLEYYKNISIYENTLSNQSESILINNPSSSYSFNMSIQYNDFNNFRQRAMYISYADKADVSFNKIKLSTSTSLNISSVGPAGITAYYVDRLKIIGNSVDIVYNSSVRWNNEPIRGIECASYISKANISNNNVNLYRVVSTSTAYGDAYGIVGYIQDCQLNNNVIKVDSNSTVAGKYRYGIVAYNPASSGSDQGRNIIQGNHIDCVNNDAKDIGIRLIGHLNQGGDNVTYNVGVSIQDVGSSNSVTAKDI